MRELKAVVTTGTGGPLLYAEAGQMMLANQTRNKHKLVKFSKLPGKKRMHKRTPLKIDTIVARWYIEFL
ncbi:hypothetical protein BpHYR1_051565 [Brachionus plicatilis]|uniref:Uncharacterized protein n=1 Tax=Brachionus plicatilis TaxID=10195 RepID=A0A3M7RMS0_BRAPC|nr:hypothetical protein BpHYR1_051565 [Brachionus plicatilis]